MRGKDLNLRPLGYEPVYGVARCDTEQSNPVFSVEVVTRGNAVSRLGGHILGHRLVTVRSSPTMANLVLPPVVELRGPGAFVVGDMLRCFQRALVLQVRGDAAVRYNLE